MNFSLYEAVGRVSHSVIEQAPSAAQWVCTLITCEVILCEKP